jgi:hypothetical protein
MLIVPYVMIAVPMALLHRWLLLKLFAAAGPAAPAMSRIVPGFRRADRCVMRPSN